MALDSDPTELNQTDWRLSATLSGCDNPCSGYGSSLIAAVNEEGHSTISDWSTMELITPLSTPDWWSIAIPNPFYSSFGDDLRSVIGPCTRSGCTHTSTVWVFVHVSGRDGNKVPYDAASQRTYTFSPGGCYAGTTKPTTGTLSCPTVT
ncbi:hypothetical protein AYO39_01435 [Actinobacteria bacterium SCGC AG-212-D09]|nr:hypothetical protein AYO39_01435 [Actinobacteria bacterium SCGC AG-212-D09]